VLARGGDDASQQTDNDAVVVCTTRPITTTTVPLANVEQQATVPPETRVPELKR
jgi:hypothetical protein